MNIVSNKERFLYVVKKCVKREGIEKLLSWIERSDFFVSPASTQYNLCVEGGLCQHALNVLDNLTKQYYGKYIEDLTEEEITEELEGGITVESIVIVSLFSSLCKANCYSKDFKNVKVNGKWEQQEYWKWSETFTYSGRGSKSVFILQQYIKLWVEEAQAIAFYLAGEDNLFAGIVDGTYRKIYEESELATRLHLAEITATYITDRDSLET